MAFPNVFLPGANIPRAKALALDAALVKGWRVASSKPDHVIFETLLDTPASEGPPGAQDAGNAPAKTLLRIRADFVEAGEGVTTSLQATEIWYPGAPEQWQTDVTRQYRANLMNALSSLAAQWTEVAPQPASRQSASARPASPQPGTTQPGSGQPRWRWPFGSRLQPNRPLAQPSQPAAPTPAPASPARPYQPPARAPMPAPTAVPEQPQPQQPPADAQVGVWAYHAEEYAVSRGCELADSGAVLIGESDGSELHRVYCRDRTITVRCDRQSCADGN